MNHVYQEAIRFIDLIAPVTETLPAPIGYQLRRAALSVPLEIAEGSGRPDAEAHPFFARARGSAMECAAILDVLAEIDQAREHLAEQRRVIHGIVSTLTRMTGRE